MKGNTVIVRGSRMQVFATKLSFCGPGLCFACVERSVRYVIGFESVRRRGLLLVSFARPGLRQVVLARSGVRLWRSVGRHLSAVGVTAWRATISATSSCRADI
ncbi:hypothetical protein GCM10011610_64380 [Nocardia rhizosphaerihabitans]|uniref:Uncharacterized protein n=1 Tax=Nocardia rhizosphaerihabitans TaxID=1691570 RepID=A0ABQ2L092_9NOCA|nr:hypothetical protein GCM10011610_64380 [Nocardia rhizosphaerihabitans]